MLVVVAVIGLIAALAIPSIGGLNNSAKKAVDQRNAQNIVSTFHSGSAAGINWSGSNRNEKVGAVVTGDHPTTGAFLNKNFQVHGLSPEDQASAYPYIGMDVSTGDLFYDKAGGQPSS